MGVRLTELTKDYSLIKIIYIFCWKVVVKIRVCVSTAVFWDQISSVLWNYSWVEPASLLRSLLMKSASKIIQFANSSYCSVVEGHVEKNILNLLRHQNTECELNLVKWRFVPIFCSFLVLLKETRTCFLDIQWSVHNITDWEESRSRIHHMLTSRTFS